MSYYKRLFLTLVFFSVLELTCTVDTIGCYHCRVDQNACILHNEGTESNATACFHNHCEWDSGCLGIQYDISGRLCQKFYQSEVSGDDCRGLLNAEQEVIVYQKGVRSDCSLLTVEKKMHKSFEMSRLVYEVDPSTLPHCLSECFTRDGCFDVSYKELWTDCFIFDNCSMCTEVSDNSFELYNFRCTAECGYLPDPGNGDVWTGNGTFEGKMAVYSCNAGYQIQGTANRTCGSDGFWSGSAPTCLPIECGIPPYISNGVVSFTSTDTAVGAVAQYYCHNGYSLYGASVITCQSGGSWFYGGTECRPVDCGTPVVIQYGIVGYSTTTFESEATYTCEDEYRINGSSKAICQADGSWTNAPECIQVDCGNPVVIQHGNVVYSTTTLDSVATYTCEDGFLIAGSSKPICQANASWTSVPECNPVDCGVVTEPVNGYFTFYDTMFGDLMYYGCNTGYVIQGNFIRECTASGEWSDTAPTCEAADCGNTTITKPTNGNFTYNGTVYGDTVNYTCNTGYVLQGNSTRECNASGAWSNTAPTCEVVDCGNITTPSNGNFTYTGTVYGDTVNYTCNIGYILQGNSTRECNASGAWTNTDPTCEPVGGLGTQVPTIAPTLLTISSTQTATPETTTPQVTSDVTGSSGTTVLTSSGTSVLTTTQAGTILTTSAGISTSTTTPTGSVLTSPVNTSWSMSTGNPVSATTTGATVQTTPTALLTTNQTQSSSTSPQPSKPKPVFIWPCLCSNHTFANMTQDEIIEQLTRDIMINDDSTNLAINKKRCMDDSRTSAQSVGLIGATLLVVSGGFVIAIDLLGTLSYFCSKKSK